MKLSSQEKIVNLEALIAPVQMSGKYVKDVVFKSMMPIMSL